MNINFNTEDDFDMHKKKCQKGDWGLGIGDWGLGIGDWGLGIGEWAQSPIPNPQSPIPQSPIPKPQKIVFILSCLIISE